MREQRKKTHNSPRPGLTLMELVVVLAVLAALAAVVIPMFPNMLRRAHKASDATQTQELAKLIQMYQGLYVSYPNDWDLLTDNSAGFPDFIPSNGSPFGGFVTVGSLVDAEVSALASVGITSVQKFAGSTAALVPDGDGIKQPTLFPYAGLTMAADRVPIDTSTKFAVINLATAQSKNPSFLQSIAEANTVGGTPPKFIVLGVGPRSNMVGTVMQDAPTSVPQNRDLTPMTSYMRFGAIFMVSGGEVSRTGRARFIAAVAMEDDELELTTKDTVGYYQVSTP